MTTDQPYAGGPKDELISTALERFRRAAEAERLIREEGLDDLRFFAGEQWPDNVKKQRNDDKRPCLTVNRLPQVVQQVTNEQRQSRPETKVNPVGGGADVDTAEILQGMIRHIDVNSDASIAHDNAFECAVRSGFGFWRYLTEYCDETSFDQEIICKRILNPFTVYFDPSAVEPDYSDAKWAFIVEDMPLDDYKAAYPKSELASLDNFESLGDSAQDWASQDSVRIAEYFRVETETQDVCLLEDGSKVFEDELPKGARVIKKRPSERRRVKWSKINACEELESQDWAGKWIPIVPVLGTEIIVEGDRHLLGVIRFAKDSQRMYNYHVSAQTESIGLAPKSPFIVAAGQIEGFENDWASANTTNHAVLTYNPTDVAGKPLPPPQRNSVEPPIAAISAAIMQSSADIKATTGLYDDSLGTGHGDRSGRAILARQKEGDTANLHLSDNLVRSLRFAGRILVDLIPKIYDKDRIVRIIKPDETVEQVAINQPTFRDGMQRIYDVTKGRYDVTVSVGASYESRRQEAVEAMLELSKSYPPLMQIAGDVLVKNMDWPEAQAVSERLKKMLPDQLKDPEENQDPAKQLQQAQAQLQQMGMQHDAMVEQLHKLTDIIKEKRVEADSKIQMELIRAQTQLTVADLQARGKNAQALLDAEMQSIETRLGMLQQAAQTEQQAAEGDADRQHQAQMAQMQQGHQAAMQQGQQAHQAGLQASQQEHDTESQQAAAEAAAAQPKAA